MNERIKQLAEQAGFMMWGDEAWNPGDVIDWAARYDDELEKFAELIVRECIDICEKGTATQTTSGGAAILIKAILIKQRFGVE